MEINSDIINKEIEEALASCQTANLTEQLKICWGIFRDFEGDKSFETLKEQIKIEGKYLKVDIRSIIYGEIEEYFDNNRVRIKGCEKISTKEYWDEMEWRIGKMKQIIREQYDEGMQTEHHDPKYDEEEYD